MKKILLTTIIAVLLLMVQSAAFSQITITKNDFQTNFVNSQRTDFEWNYDSAKTFNLGQVSNSEQTFDFSVIPTTVDSLRDTTVTQFIPPTGLPGASNFPDATVAQKSSTVSGPATITFVFYYQLADDGVYGLGYGVHYYVPTVFDTVFLFIFQPRELFVPLPLTLGTQRTSVDSLIDPTNGNKTVTTRTVICNGYGSLKLPDGSDAQSLRVQTDQEEFRYNSDGSFDSRSLERHIGFWTQHLVTCDFSADTTFSGGSVQSTGFGYDMRTGAAGVREISKVVPSEYELGQNFPNPFNPTTTINFKISSEGFTSLKIYDVLGQEVASLVNKTLTPGSYSATWNAANMQSGVYFYKLQSGTYSETKKLILMK